MFKKCLNRTIIHSLPEKSLLNLRHLKTQCVLYCCVVLSHVNSSEGRNRPLYYLWLSRSQGVVRLDKHAPHLSNARQPTSAKWLCARSRGAPTKFWPASPVQLGVFLSVAQSWMCWPARLPPRWTLQRNIKLWRGPRESDAVTQWMAPDLQEHLASKASPFNMQYNRERIVNPLLSCWAQWFVCKPFIWQLC